MPNRPLLLRRGLLPLCAAALLCAGHLPAADAKARPAKPHQESHARNAEPVQRLGGLPASVVGALARANVPASAASFYVIKVGAPQAVASWNAQAPMNPASTMKLVTTFAGLQLLGPGFRWQTSLYADNQPDGNGTINGNVYLRGRGDPKLVPEEMAKMVASARTAGATTINGDLVLDRSYFDGGLDNASTIDGESLRAYNVQPDALLYSFKTLSFTVSPDSSTQSVSVSVTPALAQLKLDNRLTLTRGKCRDGGAHADPVLSSQADGTVLATFDGNYAAECGEHMVNIAALSHNDFAWGGFVAEWQRAGGRFAHAPALRLGKVPPRAYLLARHYSAPLSDIVRDINKFSNNVMARQLFLTIGAEQDRSGPANTARSARVIQHWLQRQDLNMPDLVLDNGSGLSREERISAYDMARLLQQAVASDVGPALLDSLPILGVDGTLRHRLTRTNAAGNAYLKTGTLQGVRALAGYVDALDGNRYVVVAYINHPNAARAQEAHDALMQWVYRGAK